MVSIFALSLLVADNVDAVKLVLVETSPISPHETITPEGYESLNDDASHLTQEETVKGEEPVGRDDVIGVDKYDPREIVRIEVGKEVSLTNCLMPFSL